MNNWSFSRLALYVAGIAAGGLALAGLADFDSTTWMLDIHPFNLKDFVLVGLATGGNALAAIANLRGWGKKP